MGKKPKYIVSQTHEELELVNASLINKRTALTKKINKSSNKDLLNLILNDPEYKKNLTLIYRSNDSYDFWMKVRDVDNNHPIFHYLEKILKKTDTFIEFDGAYSCLLNIIANKNSFIRSIDTWSPKLRNPEQQARSLIRHLFTKYQTPTFLEKYFFSGHVSPSSYSDKNDAIKMYIHMGSGNSMKNYDGYPQGMVIHKKAAHHLYTTPDDMDFITAIRRIQILYLGGNNYIFNALMRSPVLKERVPASRRLNNKTNVWEVVYDVDEFWLSVIKFFIDNPMIEPNKISEIIDYINNMKFVEQLTYNNGRWETGNPQQPNFTMKGRTIQSLLIQSDKWHHEMQRLNRNNNRVGSYNNIKNFSWGGASIKNGVFSRNKIYEYRIIQLLSYYELRKEGNDMHHCVATYATSCEKGICSIFSVKEYLNENFNTTTATIEIRNGTIVQVRGKYNRKIDETTMSVIKEWATYEKLIFSKYAI